MTELDRSWARSQIEAMADGSLAPESERRMQALMQQDAGLRQDVARARMLRRELRGLARLPVPRGLGRRLWNIPALDSRRSKFWMPATAVAGIAAAALASGVFLWRPGPSPEDLAREAALEDFATVAAYLQKSVVLARSEMNEAVGSGMMDALAASQGAIRRPFGETNQGAENDVD